MLTDEVQTIYYPAATLEGIYDATTNSMVNYEKQFYKIDNTKITPESSIASWVSPTETVANTKLYYNNNGNPPPNTSYPTGCTPVQTAGSSNVYELNATSNKTGLEFMIKVMAGDKLDIFGKSYYLNTTAITNANSTTLDVLSLMTNLLLAPSNAASDKGITASQLNTINNGIIPSTFFRGSNNEAATTVPKAYINYIFLDDQFKYAGGGASRVGTSGSVKDHWYVDAQLQNITAPKNGYLFVYVSNESNFDVFFDNLQVIHKPGPILEETHYYPFGLSMGGISSKAAGSLTNRYKYNGKELQSNEFSDGSGLNEYDYGARLYDVQIGRWHSLDQLGEKYSNLSPYCYVANNPIINIDPDGKRIIFVNGYIGFGSPPAGSAYWGFGYGKFVVGAKNYFKDYDPFYVKAEYAAMSGSGARREDGYEYAKAHILELTAGMNRSKDVFRFVTHSMGGAYAEGMIDYLKEQGWIVETTVHIATYEGWREKPNKDKVKGKGTEVIDAQTTNDPVTSLGEFLLSGNDIPNADIKIRKKSKKRISQIHRDWIDDDQLWDDLTQIKKKQDETKNAWQNLFFLIKKWLETNPNIIIIYH